MDNYMTGRRDDGKGRDDGVIGCGEKLRVIPRSGYIIVAAQ
jgi:hypothetical protein